MFRSVIDVLDLNVWPQQERLAREAEAVLAIVMAAAPPHEPMRPPYGVFSGHRRGVQGISSGTTTYDAVAVASPQNAGPGSAKDADVANRQEG
eukprot:15482344-Alexandrium_andersonii.AAC.1